MRRFQVLMEIGSREVAWTATWTHGPVERRVSGTFPVRDGGVDVPISEALGRVYVMRNEDDLSLTIVCETFVKPNPQTQVEVGAIMLARWLLS